MDAAGVGDRQLVDLPLPPLQAPPRGLQQPDTMISNFENESGYGFR
jgi:hypothetical protein